MSLLWETHSRRERCLASRLRWSSISNRLKVLLMVNATRQIARDQRDSSAVTESAQDAVRSLGSLEHVFWLSDQHHSLHFAVAALISGETSARDWRRALDCLQKRHPILSVCIDGEPDSVPSFRQADATPIPLRIVEDEPELRWEAEVGKELATPFNPSRAPLIRALLIQGDRPINARPLLDAGESCGVFLGATTNVFERQATDFWDIARDARIGVAANKTSENIAAQLSAFRRVVGNGADVATVAEFVAEVFASEVLLTNLGDLSFDRQFGPVTLKAMFGPAVLTGFEDHQTIGVATLNGALCLLHTSHTPPEGLLEKIRNVLAQACDERA